MINLIAAVSDNGVIGQGNDLPWKIREDLQFFKNMTVNMTIIMGRKTFLSLGLKPLPNRQNILITRTNDIFNIESTNSLEDAIKLANKDIFIIGGAQIYKEALDKNLVDVMYLTHVHMECEICNNTVMFPEYDKTQWKSVDIKTQVASNGTKISITKYTKISQ